MLLSFGQLVPWLQIEIFYKLSFFPIPVSIFPKFTLCDIFLQSRKIWGKSLGCQIHFRVLVHNILVKVIPFGHSNIVVKHRYSYCCCFPCCFCCVLCFLWVSCYDDFLQNCRNSFSLWLQEHALIFEGYTAIMKFIL